MEEVGGGFDAAHTLSDQDIVSGLARIHTDECRLAASRLAMLAEADRRGLALQLGHSSITRWYSRAVRLPEGNIAHQIALGQWLGHNPTVADALADGTVHYLHVKAIADGAATVLAADPALTASQQTAVVAVLLDVATRALPRAVHDRSQELAQQAASDARARHEAERERRERERRERERREHNHRTTDPDKPGDDADGDGPDGDGPDGAGEPSPPPPLPMSENTALNTLRIHTSANGRRKLDGDFDKLTIEKFTAALSPLTAPTPSPDGSRDPRTPERRNADGFSELLDRYLGGRASTGPGSTTGGVNVNLTVPLADLLKNPSDARSDSRNPGDTDWPFWLDWTGPISGQLAKYLSCDARLSPVIVDHHGVPLALGRSFRLATSAQREAVMIRDRCCVMCGRPAQWCQVHHVHYWQDGGASDLNNLALVCPRCHRDIHNTGWELAMGDDGHPYSIPPTEVDPERRPIVSFHRRRKHSA